MIMTSCSRAMLGLMVALTAAPAAAQQSGLFPAASAGQRPMTVGTPESPLLGGKPEAKPTEEVLRLSLAEAIASGLKQNLGVLLEEENLRAARGTRWRQLSDLLPSVEGRVEESRRQVNLAAFGFGGFPGVPKIVGPFNVFDARVSVEAPLLDLSALNTARSGQASIRAGEYEVKNARDLVVLVVAGLYLDAVAAGSRLEAVRAQLDTADALFKLATDLKASGMVPGIDVLRAQLEQETQRQRLSVAANDVEKSKLRLARAIGLAIGQRFELTDRVPYAPLNQMSVDEALRTAYESRSDFKAAQSLVAAAEAERRAAVSERLPSLHLNADYGDIGPAASNSHGTFTVVTTLTVPLFNGGDTIGHLAQAEATLRQRRAALEDFRARIDFEVRSALLDVNAADEQLKVAQSAVDLANQEVAQARDRFAAGVASHIEVVQAQESVARAADSYISTLYSHNLAKAALARALGIAEARALAILGGQP